MKTLAETLQHNDELVAGLVSAYQQQHQLDDRALSKLLKVDEFGLARLVLLKRPGDDAPGDPIREMAQAVGCSEPVLRRILTRKEVPSS
jgi:hypothetical protein